MSRDIKTIKGLSKHIGEDVKVTLSNGSKILAKVIRHTDGSIVLVTTDSNADKDFYWWSYATSKDCEEWGHYCSFEYQITEELNCLTSIGKKAKATPKKIKEKPKATKEFLTAKEVKANIGKWCLLKSGSKAYIASLKHNKNAAVLLIPNQYEEKGWCVTESDKEDYVAPKKVLDATHKGWEVLNDGDVQHIGVVDILSENSESTEDDGPHLMPILTMTLTEILEKLDEIIKCK